MCVSFQTMVSSLCRWKRLPVTAVVANQNGSLNTASSSIISIFCHETHCCFHLLCQVSIWVVVMVIVHNNYSPVKKNFTFKNILNDHHLPLVGFTFSKKEIKSYLYIKNSFFPFLSVNLSIILFNIIIRILLENGGSAHSNSNRNSRNIFLLSLKSMFCCRILGLHTLPVTKVKQEYNYIGH